MKFIVLILILTLQACAAPVPPKPEQQLALAFNNYMGRELKRGVEYDIDTQNGTLDTRADEEGYRESRYFISYWPSAFCVEGYTVFERCEGEYCQYKFEWVEGVCE